MSGKITQKRRTCIFLGAGSSKALFQVPIQSDLSKDLLAWDLMSKKRPYLSQRLRRLLESVDNLELVFSHYHNLAYNQSSRRDSKYAREFMLLRVALAQYIDELLVEKWGISIQATEELLRNFFADHELRKTDFFVVTTNYDNAIENILEKIFGNGSWYYPAVSNQNRINGIPIFKLHGSINWMENRGDAKQDGFNRSGEPVLIESPSTLKLTKSIGESGYFFEKDGIKYTPIIIPFVFQKETWLKENNRYWTKLFNETWSKAEYLMKQSSKLLFWGYSLPEADYHMFTLLVQTLENSTANFEVVDIKKEGTNMIRISSLFSERSKIYCKGLEKYLNGE